MTTLRCHISEADYILIQSQFLRGKNAGESNHPEFLQNLYLILKKNI